MPSNSAIERVLIAVLKDGFEDHHYTFGMNGTLEAFDAALEYWLMRHKAALRLSLHRRKDGMFDAAHRIWDDTDGWQCNCLEATP